MIIERISKLPFHLYPDKLLKDVLTVTISKLDDEPRLRPLFLDPGKLMIDQDENYKALIPYTSDGVSRSFTLLYTWGKE